MNTTAEQISTQKSVISLYVLNRIVHPEWDRLSDRTKTGVGCHYAVWQYTVLSLSSNGLYLVFAVTWRFEQYLFVCCIRSTPRGVSQTVCKRVGPVGCHYAVCRHTAYTIRCLNTVYTINTTHCTNDTLYI